MNESERDSGPRSAPSPNVSGRLREDILRDADLESWRGRYGTAAVNAVLRDQLPPPTIELRAGEPKLDAPTLRDQFAMAALPSCIRVGYDIGRSFNGSLIEAAVHHSYEAAAAMLRERDPIMQRQVHKAWDEGRAATERAETCGFDANGEPAPDLHWFTQETWPTCKCRTKHYKDDRHGIIDGNGALVRGETFSQASSATAEPPQCKPPAHVFMPGSAFCQCGQQASRTYSDREPVHVHDFETLSGNCSCGVKGKDYHRESVQPVEDEIHEMCRLWWDAGKLTCAFTPADEQRIRDLVSNALSREREANYRIHT